MGKFHAFIRECNTIAILLHWRSPENGLLKELFKIPLKNMEKHPMNVS